MNKVLVVILAIIGLAAVIFVMGQDDNLKAGGTKNSDTISNGQLYSVKTNSPDYFEGARGFYAEPAESGSYPGVVIIHEWWGLNDNIRAMARKLAGEGYRVLAVDLFGKSALTTEEARKQVSDLKQDVAIKNLKTAVSYLRSKGAENVASLGWCFGGGQSLQLALSGEKLGASIIYYGSLSTSTDKLKNINFPILGIFGDKDQSIPISTVKDFEKALDSLKIENEIYIYPGVGHAFANPSGANYAPAETSDSWSKTLVFLDKYLKN